jgi:hypothetical protein
MTDPSGQLAARCTACGEIDMTPHWSSPAEAEEARSGWRCPRCGGESFEVAEIPEVGGG